MNSDLIELLRYLNDHKVKYLIIGGQAVIFHAEPRYTKDLDILVEPSKSNSRRLIAALKDFGAPTDNLSDSDFAEKGTLFVFGIAPNRVDILSGVSGIEFKDAWKRRIVVKQKGISTFFCAKVDLIKMKKAAGRPQDLLDLESLGVSSAKIKKKRK